MPATYTFHEVTAEDFDLLAKWRSRPHVREWWGDDEPLDAAGLSDARVCRRIVRLAGRPFAYIQDYTVHGWADHHFFDLPAGSRGIDQYIGEPDLVGQGHGSAFVRARALALVEQGAPIVATDPDPDNVRAIAAYRKAGFRVTGDARDTPWGRILPMTFSQEEYPGDRRS